MEKKEEIPEEKSSASKDSLAILHFGPEIICCLDPQFSDNKRSPRPVSCSLFRSEAVFFPDCLHMGGGSDF